MSTVSQAHVFGPKSSSGPVMQNPQQQKVFLAGHTVYSRTMPYIPADESPAATECVSRDREEGVPLSRLGPPSCCRARCMYDLLGGGADGAEYPDNRAASLISIVARGPGRERRPAGGAHCRAEHQPRSRPLHTRNSCRARFVT